MRPSLKKLVGAQVWWCPFGSGVGFRASILSITRRKVYCEVDTGGPRGPERRMLSHTDAKGVLFRREETGLDQETKAHHST